MQYQKISILGTGWLGIPLARHLKSKGYQVKGSTTSPPKLNQLVEMGVEPYLINIDSRVVGLKGEDFFDSDVIIITIPPSRDIAYTQSQYKIIAQLIQKGNIKKIIYTSSTGVYGDAIGLVDENVTPHPIRATAQGCYFAEQILRNIGLDTTICRLAGLVGGNKKIGRFLAKRINVLQGNAPVNLVHQDDCVAAITQIMKGNHWNEIFNICADFHPPRKVFYPFKAQQNNFIPPTFAEDDKKPSDYKIISNAKLKAHLNYTFIHPDPMMF
jgi:nucleoside-diphosphate-sugar epimerase